MSAPEATLVHRDADVVEVAARRGMAVEVRERLVGEVWSIAPDRWLVLGDRAEPGESARRLGAALAGLAAVIDQSGGHLAVRLAGPGSLDLMARGSRLDLQRFVPGQVARTVMAQVPLVLRLVDDRPTFDLLLPATLARSFLHHWREVPGAAEGSGRTIEK